MVRRADDGARPGWIPVGFSDPSPAEEGRLRIRAFARQSDVVKVTSPYEAVFLPVPRPTPGAGSLEAAVALGRSLGISVGVWGSVALELYTGYPALEQSPIWTS